MSPPSDMEDFYCCVCYELRRPYTMCVNGHHACMACIARIKTRNNKCPNCMESIHSVVTPNLLAIKLGVKLGIVPCDNLGCPHMLTPSTSEYHVHACEFAMELCGNGCGARMARRDVETHVNTACPRRMVPCRRFRCAVQCRHEDLEAHMRTTCAMRIVSCEWKCGIASLFAGNQEAHERGCPSRVRACKHAGCLTLGAAFKMTAHEEVCEHRPVRCAACDAEHAFRDADEHTSTACEKSVRACVVCDVDVVRHGYEDHVRAHGFDYWHGLGVDAFEVAGFKPTAVDLGADGVVALVPVKAAADAWGVRLELRSTAALASSSISVEFSTGVTLSSAAGQQGLQGPAPPGLQPQGLQGPAPPGLQPSGLQPQGLQGPAPPGLQPSGLQPSGLQPSGLQPSGLQPSGLQPSVLQPSVLQPSVRTGMALVVPEALIVAADAPPTVFVQWSRA